VRTAPFLFTSNMAMLPASARTAASYLGGGIARGLEQQGSKIAQAGQKVAGGASSGVGAKVGNFLESVGTQVQQIGSGAGQVGGVKKRDLGLAAAGLGMGAAFVGGMGANAGVNSLMGYYATDQKYRMAGDVATVGGNVMPSNLQLGYTQLNQFGSPLGIMNESNYGNVKSAQMNQRYLTSAIGPQFNGGKEE